MTTYIVRRATVVDVDVLVRHRVRMFEDMGVMSGPDIDPEEVARNYRAWLQETMPSGTYVSWLVEVEDEGRAIVVSGGGATIIPWPPGPRYSGRQLAFVYNVYTEPEHRGRGLARRVMEAIHAYCREAGIGSVSLNASTFGQPLYESMGYRVSRNPMMFLPLD